MNSRFVNGFGWRNKVFVSHKASDFFYPHCALFHGCHNSFRQWCFVGRSSFSLFRLLYALMTALLKLPPVFVSLKAYHAFGVGLFDLSVKVIQYLAILLILQLTVYHIQ